MCWSIVNHLVTRLLFCAESQTITQPLAGQKERTADCRSQPQREGNPVYVAHNSHKLLGEGKGRAVGHRLTDLEGKEWNIVFPLLQPTAKTEVLKVAWTEVKLWTCVLMSGLLNPEQWIVSTSFPEVQSLSLRGNSEHVYTKSILMH